MTAKTKKYVIYLIIAILMFSTFEVVSKTTKDFITPTQMTFYRFIIGGIVLLPFAIRDMKRNHIKFNAKFFITFIFMGALLVVFSMNLCQMGINYSSASLTAILFSSNPLFISLFSSFILKEQLTSGKIAGLILGIIGLFVTCIHIILAPYTISPLFILGVILIIMAMLIFSFYTVINKTLKPKYGTFVCTSFSSIFGGLILMLIAVIQGTQAHTNPFIFNITDILPQFLFICIFNTGLAYFFYFDALSNLDTSISSMSFFIKPPLASILAAWVLHESITWNIILGIILILCSVFVSINFNAIKKCLFRVFSNNTY